MRTKILTGSAIVASLIAATAAPAMATSAASTSPPATASVTTASAAAASGTVAGWGTPDWRDEFTYKNPTTGKPEIDPSKWNIRTRSDLGLLPDAAIPTASEVTETATGFAHLKAHWLKKRVARPAGQSGPTLTHTSGYMDQRVIKSGDVTYGQQYGRWEIRAKVPTGVHTLGALAAFWLRNSNSGEIDIMESWGYDEKGKNSQNLNTAATSIHTQTSGSGNVKYYFDHKRLGAADKLNSGFHTWAFELTPSYAAIYVDGERLARMTPATHPNLWDTRYFNSPLRVRLNLHVGMSEDYYGRPNWNDKKATKNLDYAVDYVRIWKYEA